MRLAILMLTYGNRIETLKKTALHIVNEDIDFILVQNDVSERVLKFTTSTPFRRANVHIIQCDQNHGSAGGYFIGLKFFMENLSETNKILLLDDDNYISLKALNSLKTLLRNGEILLCNRINRSKINNKKCSANNFLGTNIFQRQNSNLTCAPYGGLVLSRKIIEQVGYPNPKLFLYGDDHEYTYRITRRGFKIIFLANIEVTDTIDSHDRSLKIHRYFQKDLDKNLLYFQIRNHTALSYSQRSSNTLFNLNLLTVVATLFYNNVITRSFSIERWRIIYKAFLDGRKFNLNA